MDSTRPSYLPNRRHSEDLLTRNKAKKRVGFTPDTTPSSPTLETTFDDRPVSWISGDGLDHDVNNVPLREMRPYSDPPIQSPASSPSPERSLTRPKPVLRYSSHASEDEIQLAIKTENSPSKSRENQKGREAYEKATRLAQSLTQRQQHYSPAITQTTQPTQPTRAEDVDPFFGPPRPSTHDSREASELETESDEGNESDFPGLQRSAGIADNANSDIGPSTASILSSLIKLQALNPFDSKYHSRNSSIDSHGIFTPDHSPLVSGANTPTPRDPFLRQLSPFHRKAHIPSAFSSSSTLAVPDFATDLSQRLEQHAKRGKSKLNNSPFSKAWSKFGKHSSSERHRRRTIEKHIRDQMSRQRYLQTLCRVLMENGAPTHRLEEYLSQSAKTLEIEAQFMYLPGCMIISFDDPETHTSGVKVIRISSQGVSLSKLEDTHEIYKDVVHDIIDVEEGNTRLEEVMKRGPIRSPWIIVALYGLASIAVGPFAFGAGWIDVPMLFLLGSLVGFLQHVVSPRSETFRPVFEVFAAFSTSLLARWLGSIQYPGKPAGTHLFCFPALAQSSIALILPGYTILCAALELMSQKVVAGSVRLVYAIIYTLFLGFGITLGTTLYGAMNVNGAGSYTTCPAGHSLPETVQFVFVPFFTLFLVLINQGRWKQMPLMVFIGFAGYLVTHYGSKNLVKGNGPLGTMMGAGAIGLLANGYARLGIGGRLEKSWESFKSAWYARNGVKRGHWIFRPNKTSEDTESHAGTRADSRQQPSSSHNNGTYPSTDDVTSPERAKSNPYGLAAVLMLPAIFVQVPSGIAISGSLVSGVAYADSITRNSTSNSMSDQNGVGSVAFNVSYSVIQIAIGITVGLSVSALFVWPFGKRKRRSGMLTL